MPRTPTQVQAVRQERREQILQAALVVFGRMGYEGASIREIAREANIAQGLLYNYFEGKEALLRAIIDQGMQDVFRSVAEAREESMPQARIERLIRRSFELVDQNKEYWRLSYSIRMQPDVLARLGDTFLELTHAINNALLDLLKDLQLPNAEIEAALLFAQIDGIAQHYVMAPEHYPLASVVDALVARYVALTGASKM